ncbi:hypothetical protein [Vibrio fluvialis]|uniref:hypothetical protein n=1 Tax=Vibrio fluvialis TaxID=676 RepID=UPI0009B7E1CB|nr:hypothetical protein [Vibrio fluvialis]ELE2166621.1 hypothetical protein [Vibrio fluvialis]MBL4306646.1 hypothetical protein [Vibrio fluvialis]MBY8110154.1 hypothetical protein [Vibrio fluvialis]MBY8293558.1 hypothetical protein [Vibrio fluvialis]MBY8309974.1 hypothetical protein [Vibrio fluvialis]
MRSADWRKQQPYNPYQLTSNSRSEIALTNKSVKPVTVGKVRSEKGTELNLDVGNLGWSD